MIHKLKSLALIWQAHPNITRKTRFMFRSSRPRDPLHITRFHSRFRIDQLSTQFKTQQSLQVFCKQQKKKYDSHTKKCKERIKEYFDLAISRKDLRSQSIPEVYGDFQYLTSANWYKDREYTLISRYNSKNKKSEIILDIMKHWPLSNYFKTIQLTKTVFSETHRFLAFGVDLQNNERTNFMIKDIEKDRIVGIKGWENNMLLNIDNVVFYSDQGIFYTKNNKNHRPYLLGYQNLATGQEKIIYEEKNESYYLDISKSKDGKRLILSSNGKQDNKVWTIDLQGKKNQSQLIRLNNLTLPTLSDHQYKKNQNQQNIKKFVNHCGNRQIIWKNGLLSGDQIVERLDMSKEYTIIHKLLPQQSVQDIDYFQKYIVLYIRSVVKPVLRIINLEEKNHEDVTLPYGIGQVSPGANQNFTMDNIIIYLNNFFVYNQSYSLNLKSRQLKMMQKFEMSGPQFNPNKYQIKVHQVPSESGEFIPLTTIIPKRNLGKRNKMILHSYGYYGISYDLSFNSTYWAALQMGWSLSFAHIRGGGEKGPRWHQSAIKQKRAASWKDLQDCTAYLIMHQFTHPSVLILSSHSAGAITIWSVINRNPHLYKAAIFSYPFLDVLSNLLDSNKALSQTDYAEFGNPLDNIETYNQIQSYSPYETIKSNKEYPFIFIIGGKNDYRCPLQNIAKFITRYRRMARSGINSNLYKIFKENDELEEERFGKKISLNLDSQKENQQEFTKVGILKPQEQGLNINGILCKINQDASHEGIADITQQIYDGCEKLGLMDYLIEQCSYDVSIDTGRSKNN